MKKKVFCLFLLLSSSIQAELKHSDLALLNDTLPEETADPYWELAWHGKVASYGDPDSQFFIARVYEKGELLPKNINQAITYYDKAARQGHLEAAAHLTELFQESHPEKAKEWLIFRAERQDVQAQLKLSKIYEEEQNYQQAVLWLEKALSQLFPLTQDLSDVSPDLIRLRGML